MLDSYFTYLAGSGKSQGTIEQYKIQLNKFFNWSELGPSDVTPNRLIEYLQHMVCVGIRPKTIDNFIAVIKAFYSWMNQEGFISLNPTSVLKRMSRDEVDIRWLDKGERSRLLRTLSKEKDLRNVAIIYILLFAGLLPNEVLALTHDDILIEDNKGTITVRHGYKPRVVPIDKDTQLWVGRYIAEENPVGNLFRSKATKEQLTYAGLLQSIRAVGKKAKIKQLSPKVLRHSFCHDLIQRGVNIEIVSVLTGISEIRNLLIYKKFDFKDLEKAIKK